MSLCWDMMLAFDSLPPNLPNVNILEPQLVPVVLQLDLAAWKNWLRAIPIIFLHRVARDQFAVQEHVRPLAGHDDLEMIPLANRLVRDQQRFARVGLVIVKPA